MKVKVSFSSLDRGTNAGNSVINTIKDPRFGDGGCHNLTPLTELKISDDPDYRVWQYKPTACLPSAHLSGPASIKDSKSVVYPCYRAKCVIQCPCNMCRGIQEEYSNIQEDFDDHRLYHHAPHLRCKFCNEVLKILPGYNYKKVFAVPSGKPFPSPSLRVLKTKYVFDHSYQYSMGKKSLKCE